MSRKSLATAGRPDDLRPAPAVVTAGTPPSGTGWRRAASSTKRSLPPWLVSMLLHAAVLLALVVYPLPTLHRPAVRIIQSSVAEPDDLVDDFADDLQFSEEAEPGDVADLLTPAEVELVADPVVITDAADLDAAPMALEPADFGSETAPTTDLLSMIGAVGGTGGGFGGRMNAQRLALANGGGRDTEAAVDRSLRWFIEHQLPDGGWSFDFRQCPNCAGRCSHSGDEARSADRCGATALALLPFLGRGFTHVEGPYRQQVGAGIAFLAQLTTQGKGRAYGRGGSLYSQGLAGIALSECYGMTRDERLLIPTQLAIDFIVQAQDPAGGGWRYQPRQPGDTSAVGWCLMALKSGHLAGLPVNPLSVRKASEFLDSVASDDGAAYGYVDRSTPSPTRSAVGLLMRMYLGWKKEHPPLERGARALAARGPTGNLYHDYYTTQIMHHIEGDLWVAWNSRMKQMLLETQSRTGHEAGSWFQGVDRGGHAPEAGGRLYTTSLATMMLEVYYRHLPIYRDRAVGEEFRE